MDPVFWGRSTWLYLHTLTFNYPSNPSIEDKQKYYTHFKNLGDMLPCPSCASSYKIFFKYIPIDQYLDDINGITFWLYIVHYLVNNKLNKNNISFSQVVKIYYSKKSECLPVEVTNLSGKCTSKPQTLDINSKIMEFTKTSTEKYMKKTADYLSVLYTDHPCYNVK